jgi:hypothetical protein
MTSDDKTRPGVLEGGQPVSMFNTIQRGVLDQAGRWFRDQLIPPLVELEQVLRDERLPFKLWEIRRERVSPMTVFGPVAIGTHAVARGRDWAAQQ